MEALRVCVFLSLLVYLSVPAKSSDLDERELKIAERIIELRKADPEFAVRFDEEFHGTAPVRKERQAFRCPYLAPSATVPTSVHKLRPGDIKVVAALGDSLTAGRGAKFGIIGLLYDYVGLSWSCGGDGTYQNTVTLPNILRQYNAKLRGYSLGVGNSKAGFNAAVTGAKSGAGLEQAQELVRRLEADPNVNINEDWILVTVFLGANDLCDYCEDPVEFSAAKYRANLQALLDFLSVRLPRALINLVEMMQVDFVRELAQNPICEIIHAFVCDCAANPRNPEDVAKLLQLRKDYQAVNRELAVSPRYQNRDTFAVVDQPFFQNTTLPKKPNSNEADLTFFASDCFHLSQKGQASAAEALWNNMVEPVGSKRNTWSPGVPIECPTEAHPYIYTAENSKRRN